MNQFDKILTIVRLSFDWRNVAKNNPKTLLQILERDRLQPNKNNIILISWASSFYFEQLSDKVSVIYLWAPFKGFRPFYDILSVIIVPLVLLRYSIKPDVFLVYDFSFVYLGWVIKHLFSCKFVLTLTNLPTQLSTTRKLVSFRKLYQTIAQSIGKRIIDFVTTINNTTKQYLIDIGFQSNQVFIFSSNVIIRDRKYYSNIKLGQLRRKYNISDTEKIIFSIGRLESEKGWDRLLVSFAKLNIPNVKLIIAGSGSLEEILKKQVYKLGIDNSVIWVGFLSRQDIWNYLNDCDIFMLLPYSEALGLVFWEAMFMHVPVIGSPVGGIIETISHNGERVFLWDDTMDIDTLRQNIIVCLDKTPEVLAMTERAYVYVVNQTSNKNTFNDFYYKQFVKK